MRLRPRAEIFIFKEKRVLADLTSHSYVTFPGGGIEMNETPIEAAKREAVEECARRVINLTPAHPPSVQLWPEGFSKVNKWGKDYVGGYSHWFTGSSSDEPEKKKHKDFQKGFDWHPVQECIDRLKHDSGGSWGDDVRVRIKILEAHLAAHQPRKSAAKTLIPTNSPFPALRARG